MKDIESMILPFFSFVWCGNLEGWGIKGSWRILEIFESFTDFRYNSPRYS